MFAVGQLHKIVRQKAQERKFEIQLSNTSRQPQNIYVTHADKIGESGSALVRFYRNQNKMLERLCGSPEKVFAAIGKNVSSKSVVVCVDDFIGSGQSAAAQINDLMPRLMHYVAAAGKYLLYPAIETNYQGTTGIAFSLTSPTLNPSTGYVVRKSGQEGFSDIHITALGSGPDIGFTCALGFPQECRWGDYSAAALDPNGQDIWMAAEDIVPQVATQVVPGVGTFHTNWGTRVWDVNGN
jgi:hypothetical protein